LIEYYFFIEELKGNITLSNTSKECYIITKNYMSEFQKFYLYNDLVQEIQKLLLDNNIGNINTNKEEIIFNNLNNEYLKKIKQNVDKYPKDILDNKETAQARFKTEQNIKYPDSFEIINKNIYEKIKIRKDNTIFDFGKKEYLINEGKIFLKIDYKKFKLYEIIVGRIDKNNNSFISNYLYKYSERNEMIAHYKYLTTKTFTMFKDNNISLKNKNKLLEINKNTYYRREIGYIYELNKINKKKNDNNYRQQMSSIENNNQKINDQPEKEIILNQKIISNIKFLTGLYFFNKDIINQTIESNFNKKEYEKGYMINEKLFKTYSKFYDYNKLKDILNNNNNIKLAIDKNKNLSNDENIEKISNELIETIPKDLKEKYISGFNEFNELLKNNELYSATLKRYNHFEFFFFDCCILVKENLIKLISTDDPEIQKRINYSEVHFLITNKKIIINYNLILNVGFVDENYKFNPEIIFLCSGDEPLKTILKDIKILGYKNVLKKVKIIENNVATYNTNNNSILVLFINVKLITPENYSINKNTNKESQNPMNLNNQFTSKGNQNQELKKISKESRPKSFGNVIINNFDKFGNIGSVTPGDEKLNISTKNMILALIDSEKIKKKTNSTMNANNNSFNKYYMLNLEWLCSYNNLYKLNELYNHLIKNKIIEKIVNNNYVLPNEKLIEKVIPYIDSIYKNILNKNNMYLPFLNNEKIFNAKYEEVKINKEKVIKNYIGFILIGEETMKSLTKEFSLRYYNNECKYAFIDKKIFVKIINNFQMIIEMGSISNETNIFTPKYVFSYSNKSSLNYSESELLRIGLKEYINCYLLFNNDYYSPIFDSKGNIIGDAILYNQMIKDYSIYQINDKLKSMIILYFNYSQLRYNGNEIKQKEYYIFNAECLKKYKILYNYEMIADVLKANNNIKDIFNEKDEINEKKLSIIIKSSLTEFNKELNEKEASNNNQNIKGGEPYYDMDNSSNLMYYNNFEMININLIENYSSLAQNQNYKCICFLLSNYVLIVLPRNLNNKNNCIIEVGKINNDNIFNAFYLMEYKDINIFIKYLKYINNTFGFKTFLETLQFNNGPFITLNDENNNYTGKIYNLGIKVNNNNLQNILNYKNNNINYKINNRNNISWKQNFQNNAQNAQNTQNTNNNINFFIGKTWNNTCKNGDKVEDIITKKYIPISTFKSIKEEIPNFDNRHKKTLSQNLDDKEETIKKLNEEIELEKKNNKIINELNTNLIKDNIDLNKKIKELEEKIKDENINEIKLNKEIYELKEKINNLEKELKEEKNKNEIYFKNKESLYKEINEKDEEIKILRTKLNRFPFKLSEGEKLMTVIFTTYDENLYYSIICKNTERFSTIENKLYDSYSEYSNHENYFIFNGRKINKIKTLEENGIKNNSIIILKCIKNKAK